MSSGLKLRGILAFVALAGFLGAGCSCLKTEPASRPSKASRLELGFVASPKLLEVAFEQASGRIRDIGDINGDGICDVGVVPGGDMSAAPLRILCSRSGDELRSHEPVRTKRWPADVAGVGDLNADGFDDYVIASYTAPHITPVLSVLLETISGKNGSVLATREMRGGSQSMRLDSSFRSTSEFPSFVSLSLKQTWVFRAIDLQTTLTLPAPTTRHSQVRGVTFLDWKRNTTPELIRFERNALTREAGFAIYSLATGELLSSIDAKGVLHSAIPIRSSQGNDHEMWGSNLVASEGLVFFDGPHHGSLVAFDPETGRQEFFASGSYGLDIFGGLLPVSNSENSGAPAMLVWSFATIDRESAMEFRLMSSATGKRVALPQ